MQDHATYSSTFLRYLYITDKERREEQASILFAMLGRLILFIMREGLEV